MEITKAAAVVILQLLEDKDYELLDKMPLSFFGNKGRMWSNTGCLTTLDPIKGECNPRLSSNYCKSSEHFGCPECLATLKQIAEESACPATK